MDYSQAGNILTGTEYDPFRHFQASLRYLSSDHSVQPVGRYSLGSSEKQKLDKTDKICFASKHRPPLSFSEDMVLYSTDMLNMKDLQQLRPVGSRCVPSSTAIAAFISLGRQGLQDTQMNQDNIPCEMGNICKEIPVSSFKTSYMDGTVHEPEPACSSRRKISKRKKCQQNANKSLQPFVAKLMFDIHKRHNKTLESSLPDKHANVNSTTVVSRCSNDHHPSMVKKNKSVKRLGTPHKHLQQNGRNNIKISIDDIRTLLK